MKSQKEAILENLDAVNDRLNSQDQTIDNFKASTESRLLEFEKAISRLEKDMESKLATNKQYTTDMTKRNLDQINTLSKEIDELRN